MCDEVHRKRCMCLRTVTESSVLVRHGVCTCSPSTCEVEEEELEVQSPSATQAHREFEGSLC